MKNVSFSVAMATYNGERFIYEQLRSIANQSLPPDELVVSDDNSTDGTLDKLNQFSREVDFPVRIMKNNSNIGYGDNFLKAISHCRNDWIAICDQDDVWCENKLRVYNDIIVKFPMVSLISHSALQTDVNLNVISKNKFPNYRKFELIRPFGNKPLSFFYGFTCCVKKELLQGMPIENRPRDPYDANKLQPHDYFVSHLANTFGYTIKIPDVLSYYRRHQNAFSGDNESKIHDHGIRRRVKNALTLDYAIFVNMANQANQHANYYIECIDLCERCGCSQEKLHYMRKAVQYYKKLENEYTSRSKLYCKHNKFGKRLIDYSTAIVGGKYYGIFSKQYKYYFKNIVRDGIKVFVNR